MNSFLRGSARKVREIVVSLLCNNPRSNEFIRLTRFCTNAIMTNEFVTTWRRPWRGLETVV
jgi:hypothetical protein